MKRKPTGIEIPSLVRVRIGAPPVFLLSVNATIRPKTKLMASDSARKMETPLCNVNINAAREKRENPRAANTSSFPLPG
jgi:hypothetical protein